MKPPSPALALVLSLAACAGPQIATTPLRPIQPAAGWRTQLGAGAPIDAQWWAGFHDPALIALIDKALANNTDIAVAMARVREARANIDLARSQLLPSLDAGGGVGQSRTVSGIGTPLTQTFAQPQLQAAYEVDLFGRLADNVAAARNAYLASQAARDTVRLAVAGATASQYITLLGLDARLAIARRTLAARADSLRLAVSRDRAGYAPRLELEQARAESEAAAQIVPQLEGAIRRSEDSLSLLVGEPPAAVARGLALEAIATPPVPDGLPSQLLERRPDIGQAADQLAAADASLSAARKRFLPQIRLTASAGTAFSSALADPITLWSVGGSVLAPLFQGGRLTAQVEAAASQHDQAAAIYQRTVLTSFREVEDAMALVQ